MNTVTTIRRRAGAPAMPDTRSEARYMSHPDACADYLLHTHRVIHTQTPPEREYATYDRDPKARARFWLGVAAIYAAVFVGGYLYLNR